MGLVTDWIIGLISRHVESSGTVVWYDPERAYTALAEGLSPEQVADARVLCYRPERGFIALRREIEPLWGDALTPPRLVVYVPLAKQETHNALIEFEVAGVVLLPGQQPREQNTALAFVASRALDKILPPAALEQIVNQAQAGQLSLSELDDIASKGMEGQAGAIAVIFGTSDYREVALRFLSDPTVDAKIMERQALDNLAALLQNALGVSFSERGGCDGLRRELARHILIADFTEALGERAPVSLHTAQVSALPGARRAAAELAATWRNRRDLSTSYAAFAGDLEAQIRQTIAELDLPALARTRTFAGAEARLQTAIEEALAKNPTPDLVEMAEQRRSGFWSIQDPGAIKTRWDVIATAGHLLLEIAAVEKALKGKKWSAAALISKYTSCDSPWCKVDTLQRRLERDFGNLYVELQHHESLIRLVAQVHDRYSRVCNSLAEAFTDAYEAGKFEVPGVLSQANIYPRIVAEAQRNGPVAYILVDALRFEMGHDLQHMMSEAGWDTTLTPALATVPTITEVGMAALLPGADRGIAIEDEHDTLTVLVDGTRLKTRQDRINYLDHYLQQLPKRLAVADLKQLAPLVNKHLADSVKGADLVLVTASEDIDGLCENNPDLARRMLDEVLAQLQRAVRALFNNGVQTVIITADHGYLFGEKLTSGQTIDPPGGAPILLKRRVWIGRGGTTAPGVLRAPLAAFGISSSMEIATPRGLSYFKVRGGKTQYFHGGLSLQELTIPVLVVKPGRSRPAEAPAKMRWAIRLGGKAITTRFVSVTVEGRAEELLPIQPPTVRAEIRAGDEIISVQVSASYGFDEERKEVRLLLREDDAQAIVANTITLMIKEVPQVNEVAVHLLDAQTGVSLYSLDHVPLSIRL
ncbi:MAG: PglZ domain-containing protein [Anaerolineales bacterium]